MLPSPVLWPPGRGSCFSMSPSRRLDEKIRREMQAQLKDIQRVTGTAFVYVTHDQEEALTMSDRVAVLNWGHLVQVDEPHALFRHPRTKFVASFFRGSNVVEGKLVRAGQKQHFRMLGVPRYPSRTPIKIRPSARRCDPRRGPAYQRPPES